MPDRLLRLRNCEIDAWVHYFQLAWLIVAWLEKFCVSSSTLNVIQSQWRTENLCWPRLPTRPNELLCLCFFVFFLLKQVAASYQFPFCLRLLSPHEITRAQFQYAGPWRQRVLKLCPHRHTEQCSLFIAKKKKKCYNWIGCRSRLHQIWHCTSSATSQAYSRLDDIAVLLVEQREALRWGTREHLYSHILRTVMEDSTWVLHKKAAFQQR